MLGVSWCSEAEEAAANVASAKEEATALQARLEAAEAAAQAAQQDADESRQQVWKFLLNVTADWGRECCTSKPVLC